MSRYDKEVITINIPEYHFIVMEALISKGKLNSRSETIREALKDFLTSEPIFVDQLKKEGKIK